MMNNLWFTVPSDTNIYVNIQVIHMIYILAYMCALADYLGKGIRNLTTWLILVMSPGLDYI